MIFDAVSNHAAGKLSMDLFKAHIAKKRPAATAGAADPSLAMNAMVRFSHQLPTLKQIDQLLVDEALKRANHNQSIAALSLGISRQALNKRLKKANLKNSA